MKIIFIALLFTTLYTSSYASNQLLQEQDNNKNLIEQKKLETKADLAELVASLELAYKMGDKSKAFILASVYMKEHQLKDGVVEKDTKKALDYLLKSLDAGYGISAWYIVMLRDLQNHDYFKALDIIEKGLNSKFLDKKSASSLSLTYGTVVLQYLSQNQKYVRKAIENIGKVDGGENIASLDYVLANLLNIDGKYELANAYLNSACNNPNAPKEIKNACYGGSEIVTYDAKTGAVVQKDLATCMGNGN